MLSFKHQRFVPCHQLPLQRLRSPRPFMWPPRLPLLPKQEHPESHITLASGGDQLIRSLTQLRRCVHVRELILFIEPHRHAKIVLPEEKQIHTGNGRNLFNILDARGAISVTERVGVIARVRALAVGIAKAYLAQ